MTILGLGLRFEDSSASSELSSNLKLLCFAATSEQNQKYVEHSQVLAPLACIGAVVGPLALGQQKSKTHFCFVTE